MAKKKPGIVSASTNFVSFLVIFVIRRIRKEDDRAAQRDERRLGAAGIPGPHHPDGAGLRAPGGGHLLGHSQGNELRMEI